MKSTVLVAVPDSEGNLGGRCRRSDRFILQLGVGRLCFPRQDGLPMESMASGVVQSTSERAQCVLPNRINIIHIVWRLAFTLRYSLFGAGSGRDCWYPTTFTCYTDPWSRRMRLLHRPLCSRWSVTFRKDGLQHLRLLKWTPLRLNLQICILCTNILVVDHPKLWLFIQNLLPLSS